MANFHSNSYYSSRSKLFTSSSILDFTPLTKEQRAHMAKVYLVICLCSLATFYSIILDGPWHQAPEYVAAIALVICTLILTRPSPERPLKLIRLAALAVVCVAQGILLERFVIPIFAIDPRLVTDALMLTVAIFGSFSVAALLATSRLLVYITSYLFASLSYLSFAILLNWWFQSRTIDAFIGYAYLLVISGFVIFDTQVSLADFNAGDCDYVRHAVMLFFDLVELFQILLRIFVEKERKKQRKANEE